MAERMRQLSGPQLDHALIELGARLAYPPTPDLASAVRRCLQAQPVPRPWWTLLLPRQRSLAFAVLVLALLTASVLALSPAARTAIAERLGVRGIGITYVPFIAAPTPAPPPGASLGQRLSLGRALSLPEARARVSYQILRPTAAELGEPDEVYLREPPRGGQITLVYRARTGLPVAGETDVSVLLIQFRGALDPRFFAKALGPGSRLEQVTANGVPGFWIEGRPHLLSYRDARGEVRDENVRLAGNVLLWDEGDLTLRLEGALTKEQALRIAASVR